VRTAEAHRPVLVRMCRLAESGEPVCVTARRGGDRAPPRMVLVKDARTCQVVSVAQLQLLSDSVSFTRRDVSSGYPKG
jgi:hypothetical protein